MSSIADVRDIFQGALASLGGFGGRMAARLILMIVAGHQFGAAELGMLGQVEAIVVILTAIGVMGLKRSLHSMLSQDKKSGAPIERRVLEAILISTIVAVILTLAFSFVWPYLFHEHSQMPPLLIFAIPALVFTEVSLTATKYKRIIKWDILSRCIMEPWTFLGFAVALYYMGVIENGLVIAFSGSIIVAAIFGALGLIKTFGFKALFHEAPNLKNCFGIPRVSLPIGITDIGIMMFRRIDILLLSLFVGNQGTGIYYIVQQIASIPQKMNFLFEPMMSPVMAKLHHDFDINGIRMKLIGFCRWVFTLQLGITVPFLIFGDYILGMFGPQFVTGAIILSVVLFAELVDGSFALMETPLLFAKPKIPPLLIILTIAIECVAIYFLSKQWGVLGASIGFLIAMSSLAVARLLMLHKHLHINIIDRSYLPAIWVGVLVSSVLYATRAIMPFENAYIVISSMLAGFAGFYYLIKYFGLTKTDRIMLRRLIKF